MLIDRFEYTQPFKEQTNLIMKLTGHPVMEAPKPALEHTRQNPEKTAFMNLINL